MISDAKRGWVRQDLICLDLNPPVRRQIPLFIEVHRVGIRHRLPVFGLALPDNCVSQAW